jgi:hypothetical protein
LLLEAVAEAIIRSANDHPNFVILLSTAVRDAGDPAGYAGPRLARHAGNPSEAGRHEQALLLDVLQVTVMLDGRPRRRQKQFLHEVYDLCGQRFDPESLCRALHGVFQGAGDRRTGAVLTG